MATVETIERNLAEQLVEQFDYARKRTRLYPNEHRFSKRWSEHWYSLLSKALRDRDQVDFAIVDGEMYVNGELLPMASLDRSLLIEDLCGRSIVHIIFHRGFDADDLTRFLYLTTAPVESIDLSDGWDAVLQHAGVRHIEVSPTAIIETLELQKERSAPKSGESVKVATELYRAVIEAIVQAYVDARAHRKLNVDLIGGVVGSLVSTLLDYPDAVRLIAELKQRDEYTMSHSVNVAVISLMMGGRLQLPTKTLHRLGLSALLHDIGKAAVPEDILNKNDSLSAREWDVMQSHSLMGAKTLAEHENMDPLAIVVAAEHHARQDLSGYPKFHTKKQLHAMSKIVAIADTYDALTSDRSYRKAMLPDAAMKVLLEGSGSHFDPDLLRLFVQMSGMYPVGALVELNTGDLAMVEHANPDDLFKPVVRVVREAGRQIEDGPTYNLADPSDSGAALAITRAVDADAIHLDLAASLQGC